MFCPSCGANVADGTAFCGTCGKPIIGYSVGPTSAPAVTVAPPVAVAPGVYVAPATTGAPRLYAGFWLRVVAYIIDSLVAGVAIGVVAAIGLAIVGIGFFRDLGQQMSQPNPVFPVALFFLIASFWIITMIAMWLYFAMMESSVRQGTLGKMALGLVVTDMEGRRISFGRATARFFSKLITGLVPLAIGYIMAGFTEKKQALHDMIASCLVLRTT
jgi:uncharacterized RDD family membrane protein YckC